MSHHCMICLLESHCNNICNVAGIYRWKFFVSIFTGKFYHRVNFVGNIICKTYMSSYYDFFYSSLPTMIPSVYTMEIFLSVFIMKCVFFNIGNIILSLYKVILRSMLHNNCLCCPNHINRRDGYCIVQAF
jgi:hypothetical protein